MDITWFKGHNPLYTNMQVNDEWAEKAACDNKILWNALTIELEEPEDTAPQGGPEVADLTSQAQLVQANKPNLRTDLDTSTILQTSKFSTYCWKVSCVVHALVHVDM